MAKKQIIDEYFCETGIKLATPFETPGGSKITVVKVVVDIFYTVSKDNEFIIDSVKLCKKQALNMSSLRGEGWHQNSFKPNAALLDAVRSDLAKEDSHLNYILGKILPKSPTEKQLKLASEIGIRIPKNATRHDVSDLISKSAPSKKQLGYAKSLGIKIPKRITRQELGDLIDVAKGVESNPSTMYQQPTTKRGFKAWVRRKMIQLLILCLIAVAAVLAIAFAF